MKHELPEGFCKDIVGYCDPLSVRAGEKINFKFSAYVPGEASASVVRLISGDDRPHGTGLLEEEVVSIPEPLQLFEQPLLPGSYATVCDLPGVAQGTISFWFYPTLLRSNRQTMLSFGDLVIGVGTHGTHVGWKNAEITLEVNLQQRRWHHLSLSFGDEVDLVVKRIATNVAEQPAEWSAQKAVALRLAGGKLLLAASGPNNACFNGRMEALSIMADNKQIACWDFSKSTETQDIVDVSGNHHHGQLHQTPTRAVCGVKWDGSEQNFQSAPEQYGAIHFHEDDLTDAGWTDTLVWQVPDDFPSGQYALKVCMGESEDYVVFFVRPKQGQRKSDLLYLVPTASYLAYANQRVIFAGGIFGSSKLHHDNDAFLYVHEDVGYSMYEYHRDRSGVHFSSRLRPVLNLKPKTGTWAFNADTHITAWLEEKDYAFDVLTDEDLHLEGAAALTGYRTILTGTHPEYYSTEMRQGLSTWLGNGGRLMYMGGNGFYWRVAFQPGNPAIMEVRRAEDGTRAWISQPGEYYHQFTGEYGGLWRRLGKPPNELVGVGFAAQGFDGGTHYRLQSGALNPRVDFIVEGVDRTSDSWGKFGNQGGGAAGEEIDRWDVRLGSPAHAVVIATSEDHRPGMLRTKEEFHMMENYVDDPTVHADMVFFEVPGGGAVFSTGSISYAGSLAHNKYNNEVETLTSNVLRRFLDARPFEYPVP